MFEGPNPNLRRLNPPKRIAIKPPGESPVLTTEVSVSTTENGINTISDRHAKRLLDRVQRGETLTAAANAERLPMAVIRDPVNPVHLAIQQMIGTYFLPADARKQMVRAGLNRIFITNVASTDVNQQRLALDAAKQIGADPEVGLNVEPTGGIVINIGELDAVFAQIQNAKPPEILDAGRPRTDRTNEKPDDGIIDAEV